MSARILVVDDILPNVKLLEAKLSSEYYDVITATNGPEALEKIERDKPDLVLLDVMMPGMDGFEVCARIKARPDLAHIPVVMVTALTDSEDKVRGLEAGADDFLSKPINDTALMARVRSLVRLKMAQDEWRIRENTASQLGVVGSSSTVMEEPVVAASILVVDDQDFEKTKIRESLSKDQNTVVIVDNGAEALQLIEERSFDVFVISLSLENEDGLRLCSHLKTNERSRIIPILMIGEERQMDRIVRGLEIGVHDYILTPLDRNELLARVKTQIRRRRFQRKLQSSYEISLSMALTDSLTGLHNRRYMEVHLEKLLEKNVQSRKSLAILLLDIDHFKQVNDSYGHGTGDEILKEFAGRLRQNLRSFDLVVRLGGEEFVVILPDVTEARAHMIAERLRRFIADRPFSARTPDGPLSITTSIGGLMIQGEKLPVEDILQRVDKCLYAAKDGGRNCTVFEETGKLNPEEFMQRERGEEE
ncbi:MAG: PleD family two-component system response regulator [Alphaproteobacteria bacterium]|nr:PleD family two-component system response regulator [Alphaproteobacteria bacterium]